MFEIKSRDGGGRICRWRFGKNDEYTVSTPQIAIVVNPNNQIVPVRDLQKKFGAEIVITNAYIARKSRHAEDIENKGLHKYFKWKGPIYTDSGTYQMHSKGKVDITPSETLEFQKSIGSDIITPLDLFTEPNDSLDVAKEKLRETILRIKEARESVNEQLLVGPVQGGAYVRQRARAARLVSKIKPDIYAIGGIVPLMSQYRYRELIDVVMSVKMNLCADKPVHAFGCGHPMVFSLLVACGVDLFDSAAYALYAKDNRYMTERGTEHLRELRELPCECPVCSKYSPSELDERLLAEHNLYQTFKEIRTIRHAIREGTLWELVEQRIRAHPRLIEAYRRMRKYNKYLETVVPISCKKAYFETGPESRHRPELFRVKQRVGRMNCDDGFTWLGIKVPRGLCGTYPVGQCVLIDDVGEHRRCADSRDVVKCVLEYQYGGGAEKIISKDVEIVHSKSTGRIRTVVKDGNMLGTLRAHDGLFIPTAYGAQEIMKHTPAGTYCVKIEDDAVPFAKEGKSAFCKFVVDGDDKIRPGDEVFVTDDKGEFISCGTALMNSREMKSFEEGVAVKTRHVKQVIHVNL